MNRITARLEALKERKVSAFIPFITAGDPDFKHSEDLVCALERAGADIIEFGVPYSDPVGDGRVIQEAAHRALMAGATLSGVLESVKRIRQRSQAPLMLFSYFNPILAYGVEAFARDAAQAGVDGVLCVDLPPDDADEYKAAMDKEGLCTIFLAAPTSPDERLKFIGEKSSGFVYYISQMGVTGERTELAGDLKDAVARIQQLTAKPVAVGFGISTPEQAAKVAGLAEGVVVGSALVRLIGEQGVKPEMIGNVQAFAAALSAAIKG